MRHTNASEFSRRALLTAAGASLFVPFFVKHAFSQTAGVPNLVLLQSTNGTNQQNFWPTASEFNSPILNTLLSDPVLAPKTTVIRGINWQRIGSPAGNGHDWGFHGLYSGYDNVAQGSAQFGGGPSLDQILASDAAFTTPFRNIHCGVQAADFRTINAGRVSFSCIRELQHAPCELDVYALYARLFGSIAGPDPAQEQEALVRLAERQSVFDAVSQDLDALYIRLGTAQRAKLDTHVTALREFETRLSSNMPALAASSACASAAPFVEGIPTTGQGNEANAVVLFELFMEFMANAIGCNLVGVLSFQFGRGGDHFHYNWLDIPGMRADAHDDVAHLDNGSDAEAERIFVEIKKWYTGVVTDLARRLDAFPRDNGRTALDESLIVWGNEMGTGPHGMEGVPIVLLGDAGGRIARTGYLIDEGAQPHHRLGASLMNIMGLPVNGFGAMPDSGLLQGLELNLA